MNTDNTKFQPPEISEIATSRGWSWRAISEKLGLNHLSYPIPAHAQTLPYMLGGLVFATFMVLFASGIYMTQFYNPGQTSSYQSVLYLISRAPFGNFVRSMHFWSVEILFVLLLAHITRVFITGSYKRPREFTWLIGLGLFLLTILFTFAGTVLSLSQEGVEALQHFNEIGVLLGPLALWFTSGFSAVVPLVGRIYVTHIVILPLLFVLLITAHFYLIHIHNIAPKATKDAVVGGAKNEKFVPFIAHMKKLAGWSFILISIIMALALLFPESLGKVGLAGVPLIEVKPRWMFLWLFGAEDVFGIKALIWGPTILFALLGIVPFIDRSPYLSPRRRPWMMVYGAVIVSALLILSMQAVSASTKMESTPQVGMRLPWIEQVLPGRTAYAHNLVFLSFTPTTVSPGDAVSIIGDGMRESGLYILSLQGPGKDIYLGTATIAKGNDSLNTVMTIPSNTPGASYTIAVKNVKSGLVFYTPLQLTVEPIAMPLPSKYPTDSRYPIPSGEIPWIAGFIAVSFSIGIILLFTKDPQFPLSDNNDESSA